MSKTDTDGKNAPKAKTPAPKKSPYKIAVGIVTDSKYKFTKTEYENLNELLADVKEIILAKQGDGIREVMISIHKKAGQKAS